MDENRSAGAVNTVAVAAMFLLLSTHVAAQQGRVVSMDHHSSRHQCDLNPPDFMVTSGCGWDVFIPSTPAAPYAVEKHASGPSYRRYSVTVAGRRFMLGTSNRDGSAEYYSARQWAEEVGKAIAQLPPFIHVLLPGSFAIVDWDHAEYARFCSRDFHGCVGPVVATHTVHMPASQYSASGLVVSAPDSNLHMDYENALLHEIGHAFYHLVPGWWNETLWTEAAEADGVYVTRYADWEWGGIKEDYAESFAAWAMLRGYGENLAPSVRERIQSIGGRLSYFDERLRESMHSYRPVGLGPDEH